VEKVFHFTYTETPQGVQEIVNTMRAITEVQPTYDNAARTLTLRGTADQLALAGWLLPQLDMPAAESTGTLVAGIVSLGVPAQPVPPQSQSPSTLEYRLAGVSSGVARVFYLSNTPTPQRMQEVVNAVRSITEIQRVTSNGQLLAACPELWHCAGQWDRWRWPRS
jgi:hypothetical protein